MTYPSEHTLDAAGAGVQAVIDTAQAAVAATPVNPEDALLSVIVPKGAQHLMVDLEELAAPYRDHPRRKVGEVTVHDADSFIAYYSKHATAGATEMYADVQRCRLQAVLNAHEQTDAGWGDHRVHLQLRRTPEWDHWAAQDRKALTQQGFAEHIEDGLLYIVDPPGAAMLEIAETFQAKTKVNFVSGNRLATGERKLTYEEDTTAAAGRRGDIVIPEKFELGLAPFEGVEPYSVTARLRYRIGNGQLSLTYLLEEPHKVLRSAFSDVLAKIESELEATALHGAPA